MNDEVGMGTTGSGSSDPTYEDREGSETDRFGRSATGIAWQSFAGPSSVLLVAIGSGLQGYANGTADAVFVALLLLITGIAVVGLLFPGKRPEMRAFLLAYGVCVLAGGLAQCYSPAVFGNLQSTSDANTLHGMIAASPPFMTMETMWPVNAPLAVLVWQKLYAITWWCGFPFGPYTGILFNALLVALAGALTVRTRGECIVICVICFLPKSQERCREGLGNV